MSFANDRDLLTLEPNLFRDVAWTAQRLIDAPGGSLSGTTLSVPGADFAAAGVGAGGVVLVNLAPLEIVARLSATQIQVSRLRDDPADPPLPPGAAAGAGVQVWTFAPQIRIAHEQIMRAVGIEPTPTLGDVGALTPASVTNPRSVARVEALGALHLVFTAASALVGGESTLWQKAAMYRERFADDRRRLEVGIDLNGDGSPDAVRRVSTALFVRV